VKVTVKVEGLSACAEALRELPRAVARDVMLRILTDRAEPIAESARNLAPVDLGDLRDSITVSTRLTRRQRGLHRKEGADDVEVFVGPGPHPQAHLQEFGTVHHPPQPFMRPAWDEHQGKLLDNIAEDLWGEIRQAAGKGG
jgi:HK97 gp10 family phage protein